MARGRERGKEKKNRKGDTFEKAEGGGGDAHPPKHLPCKKKMCKHA